jgi:ATP-dependent Clp protease ATP-binding subunit ClpC
MLRKNIEDSIKDKSSKTTFNVNNLPLTKQAEKVLKITVLEAKVLKSDVIGTEHLMLSILKNKDNLVTQMLAQYDVDYDVFKAELEVVQNNLKDIKGELPNEPSDDEPFD